MARFLAVVNLPRMHLGSFLTVRGPTKLANAKIIEHATVEALHSALYGTVLVYLRRPI